MPTSKGIESGDMKHLSDQQLMKIVQSGDHAPVAEIYDRYSGRIYGFAFRFLRNAEAAEDAMHDAFMKMLRGASQYNGEAKFSTWLYTITANLCRDLLRKSENRVSKESEEVLYDLPGPSELAPDYNLEHRENEALVERLLSKLSPDQREAIVLARYQGLSYAEIAQIAGCSEGAVKTRIFRGMELMKRHLTGDLSKEDRCLNVVQ
jgi:RNA polymerase sigma-70 factor (ECF subfamily)